jgi:hypothetical protein
MCSGVLAVLFLVVNEGYPATGPTEPVRPALTAEATRLARLIHTPLPQDGEVASGWMPRFPTAATTPDPEHVLWIDLTHPA